MIKTSKINKIHTSRKYPNRSNNPWELTKYKLKNTIKPYIINNKNKIRDNKIFLSLKISINFIVHLDVKKYSKKLYCLNWNNLFKVTYRINSNLWEDKMEIIWMNKIK
jgi:hypothetical protein